MTDDYVPLTDEQVGAIRDDLQWRVPDVLRRILADREHYKRRAETAERCQRCKVECDHVCHDWPAVLIGLNRWICCPLCGVALTTEGV